MTTLADVALSCAIQLGRANQAGTAIIDLEAQIKKEIQEAIRNYNRKPWHLTETRNVTLTTVNGTTWYDTVSAASAEGEGEYATSLSVSDILHIEYMRENASSLTDGLYLVRYEYFEQLQEGSTIGGPPTAYTRYAGRIGIYPTPSDAWALTFSANMKPAIPTADADESVWFNEAAELIEASACGRVALKYLRDTERANEFGSIANGLENELHGEYVRKSKTGRVKVHC